MSTHSIKLASAMQEIIAILRKYDIAGSIMLCDYDRLLSRDVRARTIVEFQLVLDPTWSCIEQKDVGHGTKLHFKGRVAHHDGNERRRNEHVARSIGMIDMLGQQMARSSLQIMGMAIDLKETFKSTSYENNDNNTNTSSLS